MSATHAVVNQPRPLVGNNLFAGHRALHDGLTWLAPGLDAAARAELETLGEALGSAEMQEHARLANQHRPRLHTHDRAGRRIDEVEFHPSYHVLMALAAGAGLQGSAWSAGPHAHLRRAAAFMLFAGLEPAVLCPMSMSYAVLPALRANPALIAEWGPRLAARAYDGRFLPAEHKRAATMGMGMTEKQGGSDVRANTTRAEPDGEDHRGRRFRLTGHKWFFSAPMSDAFLVLAQAPAGLSCFFVPRWLPADEAGDAGAGDGRNALRLQRLKDKLGNHANASAEVEFEGALGWLVGTEGRGITQILEMGNVTRLDCALTTAGLMRQALALALNHTAQRHAFGKPLAAQPLMREVLADLALESEAATALALRLAATCDRPDDAHEAAMRRLLTPVAKFWICKRGSGFAQEAMECLGGNGYVEDEGANVMARLYREMPLNSIWEGAGNIMALDTLRALRDGACLAALDAELAAARGRQPDFDRFAGQLLARLADVPPEHAGRRVAQEVALALQAACLARQSPAFVFEAFCRSRLGPGKLSSYGGPGAETDSAALIERAMPS